jgi:hypothetical protein
MLNSAQKGGGKGGGKGPDHKTVADKPALIYLEIDALALCNKRLVHLPQRGMRP